MSDPSPPKTNRLLLVLATAFLAVGWVVSLGREAAEARLGLPPATVITPGVKFMGNNSCATAPCHGADAAKVQTEQNIGDECTIWTKSDPHQAAFKTLKSADSKKIADALKIPDAAGSSKCLTCHATDVPKEQRGELFSLADDAVGCESCHGGSEKWANPHQKAGWTKQQRGELGAKGLLSKFALADTNNLELRANTCVACHLQIDKEMLDAGHPALEFELYAYNYYISKKAGKTYAIHWDEPTGKLIDARLWATGQAAALAAAKSQAAAWKAKGQETKLADGLVKVYEAGVAVAKAHFGGDTAEALSKAAITGDKAAAAAKDLAKAAPAAGTAIERRIVAFGVTALAASTFDGRGETAPDAFWAAHAAATDPATLEKGGPAYLDAVNQLATMAK